MPRSASPPYAKERRQFAFGEQRSGIGDQGELWFASQLPRGWVWQPPRRDVGKDGMIVIRDDSDLNNVEFAIQVKSTTSKVGSGQSIAIKNVSRSSILYWCASTHPTLLVIVSIATQTAWYAWHFHVVDTRPKSLASLPTLTNIKIPTENVLDAKAWDGIRAEIKRCYMFLWNSTSRSQSYVFIVASISVLSTYARNLVVATQRDPPKAPLSEHEAIALLFEQRLHRNVLAIAVKAHRALPSASRLHQDVVTWTQQYVELVRHSFPHIEAAPQQVSDYMGTELAVVVAEVSKTRSQSLLLIFDLISLLTKIHPSDSYDAA